MRRKLLLYQLALLSFFLLMSTNLWAQTGSFDDPYIVDTFPYTISDFNSSDGFDATTMQGNCNTIACCKVKMAKIILPEKGSLLSLIENFTPLAGSVILYTSDKETPTSVSDLIYYSMAGNFCGFGKCKSIGKESQYW